MSISWPRIPLESGETLERRTLDLVKAVKSTVKMPVAVKLSPYFSALPHFAKSLEAAGADALVLFNRFLQPDIDIENLEVAPAIELSTSQELRLRVQWLALLYGNLKVPMAVSGGRSFHGGRHQGGHGRRQCGPDGVRGLQAGTGGLHEDDQGHEAVARASTSTIPCCRCAAP